MTATSGRSTPVTVSHATRLSTETKQSFKTTEFFAFLAVLAGILIASYMIDGSGDTTDIFRADEAWRYITALTIGYMVSRGLAKAGSREPYWSGGNDHDHKHDDH